MKQNLWLAYLCCAVVYVCNARADTTPERAAGHANPESDQELITVDKALRPTVNSQINNAQALTLLSNPVLNPAQPRVLTLETMTVTGNLEVDGAIINQNINITNQIGSGTSTNTPNALVVRDSAGDFSAGTITATNLVLSNLSMSANTGNVYIDSAGNVYEGVSGETGGTSNNVPNTLVLRDDTGSFAAQNIYLQGSLEPNAPSTTLDIGVNNAQTINLGNASLTDTINIGTGAGLQVVNVGTGSGETIINLGSPGDFINIGGTLTYVSSTDLNVVNKLITVNASGGVVSGYDAGLQVEENGVYTGFVKTSNDRSSWLIQAPASVGTTISLDPVAIATLGVLHSDANGNISTSLVVNADIATNAAITDNKLATIVTPGKVANSATTGTPVNIPNTLVLRDSAGAFAAGTITANGFVGSLAGTATGFTGPLNGDVTGTQSATVVSYVGGQSAASVAAATTTVLAATSTNTPDTLVLRDTAGAFAAGTVSASQFVGTLNGNVIGYVGGVPVATIVSGASSALAGTSTNTPNTLVLRDTTGSFAAGTISANQFVGTLNGNVIGYVGGVPAATVASAANIAFSGTSTNTPNTVVLRDLAGAFAAGTITANQFVGTLNGNVSGYVGGFTAASVASASNFALQASTGNVGTLILRDGSGSFTANKQYIIGLTNPSFVATGAYTIGGTSSTLAYADIQNHYLYLIQATTGSKTALFVINISIPSNPVLVTSLTLTSSSANPKGGFAVQGKYAYYTDSNDSLIYVIDITNPAAPTIISVTSTTPNSIQPNTSLAVQGSYLYFPDQNTANIDVYNVANPAVPVFVGSFSTTDGSIGYACALQGELLYLATVKGTTNELVVFSLLNPANPTQIGAILSSGLGSSSTPLTLNVRGAYAYYLTQSALYTVNIGNNVSSVLTPILAGSYTVPGGAATLTAVALQGNYLYLNQNNSPNGLILNISNPAQPFVAGNFALAGAGTPLGLYALGRYLFSISSGSANNFQVFDISGAYIQQLEAGGIDTTTLFVDGLARVNQLDISGATSCAQGFFASGQSSIYGQLTVTADPSAQAALLVSASSQNVPAVSITGSPNAVAVIIKAGGTQNPLQLINTPTSANAPNLYIDASGYIWQSITPVGTSTNTPNTLVLRDNTGSFAAGTITATNLVLTALPGSTNPSNVYVDGLGNLYITTSTASNSCGASTSTNTPNTLVLRDNTGSFAAGTITANQFVGTLNSNVIGYVNGVAAATVASASTTVLNAYTSTATPNTFVYRDNMGSFAAGTITAAQFAGTLTGNVTGYVGGVTAANVASAANLVSNATSTATPGTLVLRDTTASFAAGTITANQFTGTFNGNVTGFIDGVPASTVSYFANAALNWTSTNTPNTLVLRDTTGSFAAGTISANQFTGTFNGNVTGYVDGVPASAIANLTTIALNWTSTNTPNTLVLRDTAGAFAAGTITANQFVGTLNGNVIGYVGGATAASVAAATNLALAATSTSTPNTLVLRDNTGSFAAGSITANQFNGTLNGNVTGYVGGVSAAAVALFANAAVNWTSADTPNTLVLRDPSGAFAAGTITANQFIGTLNGNVIGYVGGITAANLAASASAGLTATSANVPGTIVLRDAFGSFAAGMITANQFMGTFNGNVTGYVNGFTAALVASASNIGIQASTGSAGTLILRDGSGSFTANREYIIGLATPTNVATLTLNANGSASLFDIQDQYLYIVSSTSSSAASLYVVNVSVPTAPTLISTTAIPNNASAQGGLVVRGRYAYYVDNYSGASYLYVIDIGNPSTPVFIAQHNVTGDGVTVGAGLAIQGSYVYIPGTGAQLYTYNVTNPYTPQLSAATAFPGIGSAGRTAQTQGRYLFVGGVDTSLDGYLGVFDISTPAVPVATGSVSLTSPAYGAINASTVKSAYVYATTQNGFAIINVSNPAAPAVTGNYSFSGSQTTPTSLALQGNYVYLTDAGLSPSGLILNITTPSAPALVGTFTAVVSPSTCNGVCVMGRYLYSFNKTTTPQGILSVFDVSGAYIQQLEAGGTETTTLFVDGLARVNQLDVMGPAYFGQGFLATGQSAFQFTPSTPSGSLAAVSIVGSSIFQPGPTGTLATLTLVGSSSSGSAPVVAALRLVNPGSVTSPTSIGLDSYGDVVIAASSKRFKDNIQPVTPDEAAQVYNLEPVTYDPKPGAHGPQHQFGLIAEDVEKVLPQLVAHDTEGNVLSLHYNQLPALLLAAIHELKKEQDQMQAEFDCWKAARHATQS